MAPHPRQSGPLRRVVLTGFMGSGKTTVGRLLASRLGWTFADLDDAVAERAGLSVPSIFAEQGEEALRAFEVEALRALLQRDATVVALGGGAPGTPALRDLLSASEQTAVVYLQAPISVLYRRCQEQAGQPGATVRPLLGSEAAAAERLSQREPLYLLVADLVIAAEENSPETVADAVLTHLREQLPFH